MVKVSKKAKAFQLFNEGKSPSSPEVKALGLPEGTRLTYHWEWNKKGRPADAVVSNSIATAKTKTALPGGEAIASITESKNIVQKYQEAVQQKQDQERDQFEDKLEEETEENIEGELNGEGEKESKKVEGRTEGVEAPSGDSKKKIPTTILGEGLKVTIFLSIKTLALYQIAASVDGGEELELGEFLDTCAKDYFRVRGKTLGLIIAGGK